MRTERLLIASGSGAIDLTHQERVPFYVSEVRVTLQATSADLAALSVFIGSEIGAAFNHEIGAPDPDSDLASALSFRYADVVPPVFFPEDTLRITWPNAGSVAWAVEVIGYK